METGVAPWTTHSPASQPTTASLRAIVECNGVETFREVDLYEMKGCTAGPWFHWRTCYALSLSLGLEEGKSTFHLVLESRGRVLYRVTAHTRFLEGSRRKISGLMWVSLAVNSAVSSAGKTGNIKALGELQTHP